MRCCFDNPFETDEEERLEDSPADPLCPTIKLLVLLDPVVLDKFLSLKFFKHSLFFNVFKS